MRLTYDKLNITKMDYHKIQQYNNGTGWWVWFTVGGTWSVNGSSMHLMYYLSEQGERVYTLKKTDFNNKPTHSAHPGK